MSSSGPYPPVILCYHRITSDNEAASAADPRLTVGVSAFRRQMEYVRRRATPVTLAETLPATASGAGRNERLVAVTFDDGYADSLSVALPVLRMLEMTATFFVTTGYVDDRRLWPWWDRLDEIAVRLAAPVTVPPWVDPSGIVPSSRDGRRRLVRAITGRFFTDPEEVEELLWRLESSVGIPPRGVNRFVDWNYLRLATRSGLISIGSHAVTHRPFDSLSEEEAREEAGDAKTRLEQQLSVEVRHFAYPHGRYRPERDPGLLRSVGYEAAFTVRSNAVSGRDGPFAVPRLLIGATDRYWRFRDRFTTTA